MKALGNMDAAMLALTARDSSDEESDQDNQPGSPLAASPFAAAMAALGSTRTKNRGATHMRNMRSAKAKRQDAHSHDYKVRVANTRTVRGKEIIGAPVVRPPVRMRGIERKWHEEGILGVCFKRNAPSENVVVHSTRKRAQRGRKLGVRARALLAKKPRFEGDGHALVNTTTTSLARDRHSMFAAIASTAGPSVAGET